MKHVARKIRGVKEATIELILVNMVEARGGICLKITTPGRRGCPDRVAILPGGRVIWVEVKRPRGGRISPHQREYIRRFNVLGVEVAIVKTEADIVTLLRRGGDLIMK